MSNKWLEWARQIQAISQSGLHFTNDLFDKERYEQLLQISAEILAEHTTSKCDEIIDLFKEEAGYQTPKVDVRGAVFQAGQLLLVQEKKDGAWALPGGFCDVGLSAAENVVKEVWEESGFQVKPVRLLAVLDMNKHAHPPQPFHYYKIFIQCEITGGKAEVGLETSKVEFFNEQKFPPLSETRNTAKQLRMLFQLYQTPSQSPLFD